MTRIEIRKIAIDENKLGFFIFYSTVFSAFGFAFSRRRSGVVRIRLKSPTFPVIISVADGSRETCAFIKKNVNYIQINIMSYDV